MTESVWDWSRTAASNANSDSAIDWAEGMSPASINNSARAMMAALAKYVYDQSGQIVTAGTSTVLTATTTSAFTALAEGRMVCLEMHVTSGDLPTLNVDSRGAKKLYKFSKTGNGAPIQIAAGDMQLGGRYVCQYDTSLDTASGGWIVLNPSADHLQAPWTDIASAATVNIGAAASANLRVTGTTGITAFDSVPAGVRRLLRFAGIVTITHNATSMILPGAANITTAAGDILEFSSLGSGNWACSNKLFTLDSVGTTRGTLIYRGASAYSPLVPSTVGFVLRDGGVGADPSWAAPLVLSTPVASTSGTAIDFTSIPSWVKRITVMLNGVSTNGTNPVGVQLGDSGGVETSGYTGGGWDGTSTYASASTYFSDNTGASTTIRYHVYTLALQDAATNSWMCQMSGGFAVAGSRNFGGVKALSATLDRIRITAGGDTFDAGSISIIWE